MLYIMEKHPVYFVAATVNIFGDLSIKAAFAKKYPNIQIESDEVSGFFIMTSDYGDGHFIVPKYNLAFQTAPSNYNTVFKIYHLTDIIEYDSSDSKKISLYWKLCNELQKPAAFHYLFNPPDSGVKIVSNNITRVLPLSYLQNFIRNLEFANFSTINQLTGVFQTRDSYQLQEII